MPDLVPIPIEVSAIEAELATLRARMTPRQSAFVDAVVTEGTMAAAATKAGYAARWANRNAAAVMNTAGVRRAVELVKALAAARSGYTVDRMMVELGRGMEFALATDNATAFVRAVELRGKLAGVLVDRQDVRVAVGGFVLNVHGLNAERSIANEG